MRHRPLSHVRENSPEPWPDGVLDPQLCWMSFGHGMFTSPPPSQEPRGPEIQPPEVLGRLLDPLFWPLEKVKKSMASKMAKSSIFHRFWTRLGIKKRGFDMYFTVFRRLRPFCKGNPFQNRFLMILEPFGTPKNVPKSIKSDSAH